jgi:SNF2 family DNA or RNA helicase
VVKNLVESKRRFSPFLFWRRRLQIIENKALLLKLRDPGRVTTVIPKSKVLDSGEVVVKWGLEEAQVLKNLRIKDVPSPILGNYSWPGYYRPFAHQKETAAFLTLHKRAFCFNEQGTGKTGSVIWAADYLLSIGAIKRVLVVCPLSIMQSAWQNDLFRFAMHRTVAIAHSYSREKRIQAVNSDAEFVVVNYDGLHIIQDTVKNGGFDLVVIDEANAYKTVSTTRWKTLNAIIKPHTWLWMLTGTPASQSPTDAYGLAKLVSPSRVPKFFGAYRDMVMQKVTVFKWMPKPKAEDIVFDVLQPAIRFTKEECLDLPEMTYTTRDVPLTAQQFKYYEIIRKNMLTTAAGEDITTVNAAANLNKLLQLSCGAVYADSGEVVAFDSSNRIEALKEVIAEASHKVLVFVPYRHAIEIVTEALRKEGINTEVINGSVPVRKRTEIFENFQTTPNPKVLVIQPQAAAHGVTLTEANVVVWFSPITSVETYLQANARVHRAGQHNPCTVVHLQGSPVEKKMYKMLQSKVDIHVKMIDLYKNVIEDEEA